MPLRFTRRILDHLAHPSYRPSPAKDTARVLRVEPEDDELFREAVKRLESEGRVDASGGLLRLPGYGDEIVGKFRLNARGFGFVIPDDPYREGDLFIPRGRTRDALSGDRVRAEVVRQPWRGKAKPGRSHIGTMAGRSCRTRCGTQAPQGGPTRLDTFHEPASAAADGPGAGCCVHFILR